VIDRVFKLPPEQQAIRDKCFHPSGTFVEFPKEEIEQSIPERFEKIVRMYPNRLAVKMGERALTYDQLNKAANRITRAILDERGPGREPIALSFGHGIDMITAIFGVLKAGKFYVALNPTFPSERLNYMLTDSTAGLVVTDGRDLGPVLKLVDNAYSLLDISKINDLSLSAENLAVSISPDDLAAIMYTSGSSGEPKGVINTHRTSLDKFFTYTDFKRITANDKLTLLHSLCFGSGEGDLLISLLNGACLFPFDMKSESVHALTQLVEREQITVLHLPPALFRQLGDIFSGAKLPSCVRLIQLSGAPITQRDFDIFKKLCSPQALLEISMGSTETRGICAALVDRTFSFPKDGAPVGYPRPGKEILLVDDDGREVGPNEVGEIAVKGMNLTGGYWRKPASTNSKFLPDPEGGERRMYLTGDLGRKLPDGFLIHLGRKDLRVKIRGYRVEIAEIEKLLLEHPGVKDAGVIASDREPGEKQLNAYLVARADARPTINELNDFLKAKLPGYMIPSTFVFLESLPLTNGKLDRAKLPLPDRQRPGLLEPYGPPRTPVEKALAEIWAEVLSLDRIGIHDNFFDLGGHSLAASRVISRVITSFQLELPLKALFESPTVAEMAAVIEAHQGKKVGEADLERMLAELESVSDEEARRLIAEESGKPSRGDQRD